MTHTFKSIGFIGTGAITAAVVKGLRTRGQLPAIHLSPRSKAVSTELAATLPNVHREHSNADVVAKSQLVILAMLPVQLEDALSEITFGPEQTVVSFVATVSAAEIAKLVAPASAVCRMTPLTTIEKRRGPIVMTPELKSVKSLFDELGEVVVAQTEAQMMAFGCAAAVVSTLLEIEDTVARWLATTGVPPGEASLYVRSMFAGVANSALENRHIPLPAMALGNETPGGLNECVRAALSASGLFTRIDQVLSELASLSLAAPPKI